MAFRPLAPRTVRWRPDGGEGLEHLDIRPTAAGGVLSDAVVIGEREGRPFGARYRILCDPGWRVLEFEISTADGRTFALSSPEPGRWLGADGEARTDLDGCIDIDLSATPFTNTLPIRRLGLSRAHGPVELAMVYLPFDTLEPVVDRQRYTAIEDGRLYRYESSDRSFTADLALDEDGLVLDYPSLFRRL